MLCPGCRQSAPWRTPWCLATTLWTMSARDPRRWGTLAACRTVSWLLVFVAGCLSMAVDVGKCGEAVAATC